MINVALPDELVRKLEAIARQENRAVPEVIAAWAEQYVPDTEAATKASEEEQGATWDMILGISDADVTDMSTTVRETLQKYFQEKYGRSD